MQIDSAQTWSVSFQRSITKDMAVDVRYVGTRGIDQWSTLDYNTRDIITNGFIDDVPVLQARKWEHDFLASLDPALLSDIKTKKVLDDALTARLKQAIEAFKPKFIAG